MIKEVLFGDHEGAGYRSENFDEVDCLTVKTPVIIGGQTITPNTLTDLVGFFKRKIKYVGLMIGSNEAAPEMIFYMGTGKADLFGQNHYFQSIFKISETRIFQMFTDIAGRDFNLIKGEWK